MKAYKQYLSVHFARLFCAKDDNEENEEFEACKWATGMRERDDGADPMRRQVLAMLE